MDWNDEAFILAEAGKILRRDVLPSENTFDGTFNDSIQKNFIPHSIKSFVDQVLGICVSYNRVLELSTTLGNNVLSHYNSTNIVCLPALRGGVFTTAALDNIDHNPGSSTAEGSFDCTGISLFQHPTKKNLLQLPANYANISPVSNFLKEPKYQLKYMLK